MTHVCFTTLIHLLGYRFCVKMFISVISFGVVTIELKLFFTTCLFL